MKLRFVTGHDIVSKIIHIGERDGWPTHVETVLPDGGLLGAHADGGVMIRKAGYDSASLKKELIVDIPAPPKVDERFHNFCYEQLGAPYDWRAIFGLWLGHEWRDPNRWFCSELMARALEVSGYFMPLASVVYHISPRDLLLAISSRMYIKGGV
jgi:hypothetical protein